MFLTGPSDVALALARVGELLALAGDEQAIVIVGGSALNLRGLVTRTTTDVDILAFSDLEPPADAPAIGSLRLPPEPLPVPLVRAAREVARDMGLTDEWLNSGPASQLRFGLPSGFEDRLEWRRYAALHVGIAGRQDLIALKLFAAVDNPGPRLERAIIGA